MIVVQAAINVSSYRPGADQGDPLPFKATGSSLIAS
jgi:hypothetical protein